MISVVAAILDIASLLLDVAGLLLSLYSFIGLILVILPIFRIGLRVLLTLSLAIAGWCRSFLPSSR